MSFLLLLLLMPNSVLLFLHLTSLLSLLACPVVLKVIVLIGATVNHVSAVANRCQRLCPFYFIFFWFPATVRQQNPAELSSVASSAMWGSSGVKSNQTF